MSSRVLLFACVAIATQQYGGAHNRDALITNDDHWMMTDHMTTTSDQPMRGADHQTEEALSSYASDAPTTITEHLGRIINKNLMMRSFVTGQPKELPRRTRTQNSPLTTILHHLNRRQVVLPSHRLYPGGPAIKPTPSPVQTKFFKEQIQQLPADIQEQLKGIYSKVGFTQEFQELLMRELSRVKSGNSVVQSGQGDISAGGERRQNIDGARYQHDVGRLSGGSGSVGSGGAGNIGRGKMVDNTEGNRGSGGIGNTGSSRVGIMGGGGLGNMGNGGVGNMGNGRVGNMGNGRVGNMGNGGVGNMGNGGVGNMGHERLTSNIDSRNEPLTGQLHNDVRPTPTQMYMGMGRQVKLETVLPRKQGSSSAASSQRSGPNANVVNTINHTEKGPQRQTRPRQSLTLHEKIDALNQTARHYVMEQFMRKGNNEIFRATVDRLFTDSVRNVNSRPEGHPMTSNTWHRPDQRTISQNGSRERMVGTNADNKPLLTDRDGINSLAQRVSIGQKVRSRPHENIRASVIEGRLPVETRQSTDTRNIQHHLQGTSRKFENRLTNNDNLNTNKLHATGVVERPEYHVEQHRAGQQVQPLQRGAEARDTQHPLYQKPKQQDIQQMLHNQQTAIQQGKQTEQSGLTSQQRKYVDNISSSAPVTVSTITPSLLSTSPSPSITPPSRPTPPTTPPTTTQQPPTTTRRQSTTIKPPSALLEFFNTTITIPDHINRDPIMRAAFLQVIQRAKEEEVERRNKMATAVLSHTPPSAGNVQLKVSPHTTPTTTMRSTSASPSSSPTPTPSPSSSPRPPTTPSFYNKDVVLTPALFMTWSLPPSQVTSLQGSPLTTILTNISASRNSQAGQSSKVEQFRSFLIQTMMTDPQSVVFVAGDVIPGAYHERSDHGPTILVKDLRGGFVQQKSDSLSRAKRSTNQNNRGDWFKVHSKMADNFSDGSEVSQTIKKFELNEYYKNTGKHGTLQIDTRLNFTPESQAKSKTVLTNQNFQAVCNSLSDARERATCAINLRRHHVKRSLLQCKKLKAATDKMTCRRNVARKFSFESSVSFQTMKSASTLTNDKTAGNDFIVREVASMPGKRGKRQAKDESFLIPVLRFAWMLPSGSYPNDPLNTMDYIMAKFNTSLHNRPRLEVTHQEGQTLDIPRTGTDGVGPITIGQGQGQPQAYMNSPVIILDKLIEAANALSKLPGHSVDFLASALDHTYGQSGSTSAGASNPLGKIISVLRQQKLAEMTGGIVPPMGVISTAVPHLTSTLTTTTKTPAVVSTTTPKPAVVTSSLSSDAIKAPYDVNALMLTMQAKFQGVPDKVLRSLVVHLLGQLGQGDISQSHDVTRVNKTTVPSQAETAVNCPGTGCTGQEPLTTSPSTLVGQGYTPQHPHITAMVKTHSTAEQTHGIHNQVVTPAPSTQFTSTNLPTSPTLLNTKHSNIITVQPNTLPPPTLQPFYTTTVLHPTLEPHFSTIQPNISTIPLNPTPQPRALPSPTHQPLQPAILTARPHQTKQPRALPTKTHQTPQHAILPTGPQTTPHPPPPPTVTSTYPYIPTFPYTTSSLLSTKYVTMNLHFKGLSPPETTSFPIMPLESPFTSATDKATILSFLLSINSRGVTLAPNQSVVVGHSPLSQNQTELLHPIADKDKPKLVIDQPKPLMDPSQPVIAQPVMDKPQPVMDKPQPVMDKPQPIMDKPQPIMDKPQHIIDKPQPIMDKPQPIMNKPQPIMDKPQHILDKPQPVMEHPQPVFDHPIPTGHLNERAVNPMTLPTLTSAHEPIQQPVDIHERQRKSQMPTILPNVSSDLIQLVGSALSNIISSNPAHNFLQTNNHAHLAKDALQAITSSNNNHQVKVQGPAQEPQHYYNGFDQSGNTNLVQGLQGMDSGKGIQLYEGSNKQLVTSDLLQQKGNTNYDTGRSYTSISSLCPPDTTLVCGPTRPSPRLADFCHQRCDVTMGECTSALCTCSCLDNRPMTSHYHAPTTAGPFLSPLQSHGLQISAVDPDLVSTTPRVTHTTGSAEQRLMRFLSLVDKVKATKGEKTTEEPEADR